jgi:hypothetical protein
MHVYTRLWAVVALGQGHDNTFDPLISSNVGKLRLGKWGHEFQPLPL